MPAGDSSRVWFPEMIDVLRTEWRPTLSGEELVRLAQRLDAMLKQIRAERALKGPMFRCSKCGGRHEAVFRVSVRAAVLATVRFGIATQDEAKLLEKRWMKYRKQEGLNLYGELPRGPAAAHSHTSEC